jgi:hypothetical protein
MQNKHKKVHNNETTTEPVLQACHVTKNTCCGVGEFRVAEIQMEGRHVTTLQ